MPATEISRRGLMLVLSSPSGAGKTTIAGRLMKMEQNLEMSVSVTTRPKRRDEVEGRDYHFVDLPAFDQMVERGELLEYAKVFGHCYGTPAAPVHEAIAKGRDVLFDIDWQGAQQLAQSARRDLVGVFILPPSTAELERRLKGREQDSDEVVAQRMAEAAEEMSHWAEYDYIVINDGLERALAEVRFILEAERLKRERRTGLIEFVKALREGQ